MFKTPLFVLAACSFAFSNEEIDTKMGLFHPGDVNIAKTFLDLSSKKNQKDEEKRVQFKTRQAQLPFKFKSRPKQNVAKVIQVEKEEQSRGFFAITSENNTPLGLTQNAPLQQHESLQGPLQAPSKAPLVCGSGTNFAFGYDFLLTRQISPSYVVAYNLEADLGAFTALVADQIELRSHFSDAHRAFLSVGVHDAFYWTLSAFYFRDSTHKSFEGFNLSPSFLLDYILGDGANVPPIFPLIDANKKTRTLTLDFALFYSKRMAKRFIVEPFIGGRYLHLSNKYVGQYFLDPQNVSDPDLLLTIDSQFNGGGIVVGSGGKFLFSSNFYFYGNIGINGILGKNKELNEIGGVLQNQTLELISVVKKRRQLLTGFQYALGIGYDFTIATHYTMSIKIGYEQLTFLKVIDQNLVVINNPSEDFDLQMISFGIAFGF